MNTNACTNCLKNVNNAYQKYPHSENTACKQSQKSKEEKIVSLINGHFKNDTTNTF